MAVDIFLELSNEIKGESKDATHAGLIDVQGWAWGMSNSGTTHMGSGGGGGKVNVQDLSITKWVDLASHDLIRKCADGTHIDSGRLIVRKSGGTPVEYLIITFKEIMVSSYQTGGGKDGLDRVSENLSLNFCKFEVKYTLQDVNGVPGAESMAGFDIGANAEWSA